MADRESEFSCRSEPPSPRTCARPENVGSAYAYLLGLYLGDGCLSEGRRHVWRLRIVQDARYIELIRECADTVAAVSTHAAGFVRKQGCVEVYAFWKHWICMFPQHGPGRKHARPIVLRPWQRSIVLSYPREFVRGLIQSDGSRFINRVRRATRDGVREYDYVRYMFTNASPDIRGLFEEGCRLIGVDTRKTTERNISVARRESVLMLDTFIGPKA